jgi:hypothetical protein
MPRFARKDEPPGFALRKFLPQRADDVTHWQAHRLSDPSDESPLYTRRLKAVDWCWMQIAQQAVQPA